MGNNKLDGKYSDPSETDNDFDDEVDAAFDALEVHGSGVQKVDPSARVTMPDVDGVILEKAMEIARAAQVDDAEELNDDTDTNDKNQAPDDLSNMKLDDAIYSAMTIPPSLNYENFVEMTRTEEKLRALRTDGADLPHIMVEKKLR